MCERVCELSRRKSAEIECLLYCLWPHRLMQVENPSHNPIAAVGPALPANERSHQNKQAVYVLSVEDRRTRGRDGHPFDTISVVFLVALLE